MRPHATRAGFMDSARGAWTLALLVQITAFLMVRWFFVHTATGQRLDTVAVVGSRIGRGVVDRPLTDLLLYGVTIPTLAVGAVLVVVIGLRRRRLDLGVAAGALIAVANVTAEALKRFDARPELGGRWAFNDNHNTLPSGHTAAVASIVFAVLLVVPPRWRGRTALVGTVVTAFIGAATVAAGWHRPSDAGAAFFVVGAWYAVAKLVVPDQPSTARRTMVALVGGCGVLVLFAGLAMVMTAQTPAPDRPMHFVSYTGSLAGIGAAAALAFGLTLFASNREDPDPVDERVG